MTPPSAGSSDLPKTPSPSDRGPVHVVATEAGVSTRLWIDGSLVATGGVPTLTNNGAGRMLIGGNPNSAGDAAGAYRAWNGGIDDVGMWNRVLTPQEIAGLRKEWDGTVLQVSVNGGPFETVPHVTDPLRITGFSYNPTGGAGGNGFFSLTWNSTEGKVYGVYYSPDLTGWGADINDSYPADPGESTTYPFDHPAPGAPQLFFRVQQN